MESLTFISLFLIRGNLPWKPRPYRAIKRSFASLAERMGYSSDSGPLDWSPRYPILILDEPEISIPDEGKGKGDDHLGEDSYYGMDLDSWKPHGETRT